jgi:hypothetical protein
LTLLNLFKKENNMTQKRKIELQKKAKEMADYIGKHPNASLSYGFMPSEEYDYLVKCLEEMTKAVKIA